jgi:hypothetical protein
MKKTTICPLLACLLILILYLVIMIMKELNILHRKHRSIQRE